MFRILAKGKGRGKRAKNEHSGTKTGMCISQGCSRIKKRSQHSVVGEFFVVLHSPWLYKLVLQLKYNFSESEWRLDLSRLQDQISPQ